MVRASTVSSLFAIASLLLDCVIGVAVNSPKPFTVPLVKNRKRTHVRNIIANDKARIAAFSSAVVPPKITLVNEDVNYVASVQVGGQTFNLIVDTGSANTWVNASKPYSSSTGVYTGYTFGVTYGSATVTGTEWTDSLVIGPFTIPSQSIGVASSTTNFPIGADGILGLGPTVLTTGTTSDPNTKTVATIIDNLKAQKSITRNLFAIYFAPESGSDTADANGELSFNAVNTARYTGTLTYFDAVVVNPWANYWGLELANIYYIKSTLVTRACNCIVDTGTTLWYLATPAYQLFLNATMGHTDSATGLAAFTIKPTGVLNVQITDRTSRTVLYPFTPAMYLIPTAQYVNFGLDPSLYYSWINDGGASGINCILGQKFMENLYWSFDSTFYPTVIGVANRT